MAVLQRLALRGTPKATKAAARYTPAGGAERCGMCRHYAPSSSCARIEGPVSAAGWCMLYSQQVTWRPRAGQAAGGGVPAGLTLDMSFLTPGTLPPGVTFTRASTATYLDATGTMQSATANTPRWDYSPSALTLNGLLIEEARTNSVVNNTMVGAIPGTPGTLPTNWGLGGSPGLSSQVVGTGVESGITYMDLRVFGTATGNNAIQIATGGATAAAVNGQVWSASVYLRMVAGSFTNLGVAIIVNEYTSAAGLIRTDTSLAMPVTVAPLATQRYVYSPTLTGGGTVAFVQQRVVFTAVGGATVDATFRVGLPQLELGAMATSVIPTSTVAVTRAVEACSMPTGAWFNAGASSLAVDFMVAQSPNPSAPNARSPAALSDGTAANRLRLLGQVPASANAALSTVIANVSTGGASLGNPAANAVAKIAGAWNGAVMAGALNGAATVSTAVGMPAGLTTLMVGNDFPGSVSYLNGWVRRVRYWNRALAAAELQSVTT